MDWMPTGRRASLDRLAHLQRLETDVARARRRVHFQASLPVEERLSRQAFAGPEIGGLFKSDWAAESAARPVSGERRRIGHLHRVPAADVWDDPGPTIAAWLEQPETIVLLGRAISMNLEYVGVAERLAHGTTLVVRQDSGLPVIIGSWHGGSTHAQLAELLGAAAALEGPLAAIVWVSGDFRAEQRRALAWLDSVTAAGTRFYGVELELWAIDDSNLAPRFTVV